MVDDAVQAAPGAEQPVDSVEALKAALAVAEQMVTENWDRFIRKEAELQNYRKRSEQQLVETRRYAIHDFAGALLTVVDSIEHGLAASSTALEGGTLQEGLKLTHQILLDLLTKYDISVIDPLGEPFKPGAHEALTMQPATESIPHNHVLVVVQKGYQLSDRVLRPAKVVVAQDNKNEQKQ